MYILIEKNKTHVFYKQLPIPSESNKESVCISLYSNTIKVPSCEYDEWEWKDIANLDDAFDIMGYVNIKCEQIDYRKKHNLKI